MPEKLGPPFICGRVSKKVVGTSALGHLPRILAGVEMLNTSLLLQQIQKSRRGPLTQKHSR